MVWAILNEKEGSIYFQNSSNTGSQLDNSEIVVSIADDDCKVTRFVVESSKNSCLFEIFVEQRLTSGSSFVCICETVNARKI